MNALLSDPVGARFLFGSILMLAGLAARASGDEALQKAWWWLLIDWAFTCYATELLTAQWAPWVTPTETALVCIPLGNIAKRRRSHTVWAVIGLMVASLALSALAFSGHWQGNSWHNAGANVLFVLRAAVVGGAGVVAYRLRRRDPGSDLRAVG